MDKILTPNLFNSIVNCIVDLINNDRYRAAILVSKYIEINITTIKSTDS
jgi:hypothetical protein